MQRVLMHFAWQRVNIQSIFAEISVLHFIQLNADAVIDNRVTHLHSGFEIGASKLTN